MNNLFVFDIETIPDTATGARYLGLSGLTETDIAAAMINHRRQQGATSDFLPPHWQRIVCISVVFKQGDSFKVWSLGSETSDEAEIIKRFFDGIEKYSPLLISWNGTGFDLPVLHYRSLLHSVPAPRYWDVGHRDKDFKWDNYLNRYHYRHMDVMDILSGYQARTTAKLDEIATLLGFPGKMGMAGNKVFEAYLKGEIGAIRNYCETDVLNTYLIFFAVSIYSW